MSFSRGSGTASGTMICPDPRKPVLDGNDTAQGAEAAGVEQFGEYQGSGLTDATYLVRNPGGKVVQVSALLHLVLSGIDGGRTISEIAARVTAC